MPELAKQKRIFQIAKELNISHLEIIKFLKNKGTPADSHMAPVSPEIYDEILLEFSKDKLQIERHRKEQARKIVVSKMQISKMEEKKNKTHDKTVTKIKTTLKDEKLALSDKLKKASNELDKEKKRVADIAKKAESIDKKKDIDNSKVIKEQKKRKRINTTPEIKLKKIQSTSDATTTQPKKAPLISGIKKNFADRNYP